MASTVRAPAARAPDISRSRAAAQHAAAEFFWGDAGAPKPEERSPAALPDSVCKGVRISATALPAAFLCPAPGAAEAGQDGEEDETDELLSLLSDSADSSRCQ